MAIIKTLLCSLGIFIVLILIDCIILEEEFLESMDKTTSTYYIIYKYFSGLVISVFLFKNDILIRRRNKMTKRLDVLEKFDRFINRLQFEEVEHLTYVLDMLRGPDSFLENLKAFTTGRIRTFLPKSMMFQKSVFHNPLDKINQSKRDKLLKDFNVHFKHHYDNAVEAIKAVKKYDLATEKEE